jgi:CheY-like chemotaxis protein
MDISDQLRDRGFKVLVAADADEAIAMLIANTNIRVVFTDVDMPGSMDGLKLAAAVRKRWPPIKIIVTSGRRRVSLADMPADSRFFSKPYRVDAIALAMRELTC